MKTTVRFFKLDNEWYADVPGHDLEDNQMVAGADTVLEEIDSNNGGEGELFFTISDSVDVKDNNEPYLAKFIRTRHDCDGGIYTLAGPLAEQYGAVGFEVWICNVTHDVLGEHPQSIYVLNIQ